MKTDLPSQERYDRNIGLELLCRLPMGELMHLAHAARVKRFTDAVVTYVIDTNPNYTNICETQCRFCAFCRSADAADAYVLSPEQVAEKVHFAHSAGATTVLLQGGNNPAIGLEDWRAYIRAIQAAAPQIHIHPFSPAEYVYMAAREKMPVAEVLAAIYDAGVDTIPGGGAEILVDALRSRLAPRKATSAQWLDTCEKAHRIGFKTTATMMYGHLETDADIVDHLLALRDLQDRSGGFTSFIAWSYKPGGSQLGTDGHVPAHPARYVRIIAAARLLLDNFSHIQSSWFSENTVAGQLGLMAGADDFGGVLVEENVLRTAGHQRRSSVENVRAIIRKAGFEPVQRDSYYQRMEDSNGNR